jgi:glucokinase
MTQYIAVDIGGTQIRAASYHSDSLTPIRISKTSTRDPYQAPLERLQDLVASIWPLDEPVAAIGVAAPGPLDPYQGVVIAAPNIPGWINVPLRQVLEDRFQVPVGTGNDANLAALGEWMYGAGKGHHNLIYLTVSTGIGGGIIVDDRLLLGERGLAGEVGHVTVMLDGPLCGCGKRGHLEAVASGTAIARWVQAELDQGVVSSLPAGQALNTKLIAQAAQSGDELARAALARAGGFIGQALANFLHIFNPSVVIIGGGVAMSGELLLKPVRQAMHEHVIAQAYVEDLVVTRAAFGDEAGLMGSLALARTTETTRKLANA